MTPSVSGSTISFTSGVTAAIAASSSGCDANAVSTTTSHSPVRTSMYARNPGCVRSAAAITLAASCFHAAPSSVSRQTLTWAYIAITLLGRKA